MFLVGAVLLAIVGTLPTPTNATASTKLYVGHYARITAKIPGDWTVDPTGTFDYVGHGGFVASQPVPGQTLEDACVAFAASPRFDRPASITKTTWSDQTACRIAAEIAGAAAVAVVIAHPYPFEIDGEPFAYAAVIADPRDLDAIVATLDFAPDRVTPEAYATSVLDLVEARAYRADAVDWPAVHREVLDSIDDLPTVELAREGILDIVVQNLRMAGDNHSFFLLPHETARLAEAWGYGLLVGGQQVLVVYPNGPADRAGVQVGDLLDAVDGRPFGPIATPVDPAGQIAPDPAGRRDRADRLTLRRPGAAAAIAVTVAPGSYSRFVSPAARRLPDGVGYLAVPGFTTPGQQTAYAAAANRAVAAVDRSPTCGWVVDLRLDTGGSYSPMVTAVGPILGNGTFVGWRSRDDRQTWVTYQDGRVTEDGREVSDYLGGQSYALQRPHPPVAVLTGRLTVSAGEVAALAFVGRPATRLFGESTAGRTTGNGGFPLFDGTELALAVAAVTDRTGATHLGGVEPDELIPTDWTTYGTEQDRVLAAALGWLNRQPACAK
jgi:C-terminal processing protease CtpA/Prc